MTKIGLRSMSFLAFRAQNPNSLPRKGAFWHMHIFISNRGVVRKILQNTSRNHVPHRRMFEKRHTRKDETNNQRHVFFNSVVQCVLNGFSTYLPTLTRRVPANTGVPSTPPPLHPIRATSAQPSSAQTPTLSPHSPPACLSTTCGQRNEKVQS